MPKAKTQTRARKGDTSTAKAAKAATGESETATVAKKATAAIPSPKPERVQIRIQSLSPMICHRFGEKARKMMLDKQMGIAHTGREPKNPEELFKEALYPFPGGKDRHGFPAGGFRQACIAAARGLSGVKMSELKQSIFIVGKMNSYGDSVVEIRGEPKIDIRPARNSNGNFDIRVRAMFEEWEADIILEYDSNVLTAAQAISILNHAGHWCGIGDWRPERGGEFGRFAVVD